MPATAPITGHDPTRVCIERARSTLPQPFRNKEEFQGVPLVSTQMPFTRHAPTPTYCGWVRVGFWWLRAASKLPSSERELPPPHQEQPHEQWLTDTGSQRPAPCLSKAPLCNSQVQSTLQSPTPWLHGTRLKLKSSWDHSPLSSSPPRPAPLTAFIKRARSPQITRSSVPSQALPLGSSPKSQCSPPTTGGRPAICWAPSMHLTHHWSWQALSDVTLTSVLWGGNDYWLHFTDDDTKAQRGEPHCPEANSPQAVAPTQLLSWKGLETPAAHVTFRGSEGTGRKPVWQPQTRLSRLSLQCSFYHITPLSL